MTTILTIDIVDAQKAKNRASTELFWANQRPNADIPDVITEASDALVRWSTPARSQMKILSASKRHKRRTRYKHGVEFLMLGAERFHAE